MIDTDGFFTIVLPNPGTRGPGGVAPTGSTPGLVDPVEAPPLGPRLCHFCFFKIVLPNPRTRGSLRYYFCNHAVDSIEKGL